MSNADSDSDTYRIAYLHAILHYVRQQWQRHTESGCTVTINQTNGSGTVVGTPVANVGLPGVAFHPDGRLFASTVTSGNPSTLIQINPNTGGLIATIGTINDNGTPLSIGDLSFQPGTGVLYGITSNTFSAGGLLYTINLTTAAATLVGDTGRAQAEVSLLLPTARFIKRPSLRADFLSTLSRLLTATSSPTYR